MPQSAFSALGMLAIAILILVAAYWVTKALGTWQMKGAGGAFQISGTGRIRILSQVSLGRNERIVLIALGQQCFLLGVTAEGVTVLKEYSGAEAEELGREPAAAQTAGFREILRENLKKRK